MAESRLDGEEKPGCGPGATKECLGGKKGYRETLQIQLKRSKYAKKEREKKKRNR